MSVLSWFWFGFKGLILNDFDWLIYSFGTAFMSMEVILSVSERGEVSMEFFGLVGVDFEWNFLDRVALYVDRNYTVLFESA